MGGVGAEEKKVNRIDSSLTARRSGKKSSALEESEFQFLELWKFEKKFFFHH